MTPPVAQSGGNIQTPSQSTPPPTSSKKWLWIVIIVAVVAAAGAGGYWWWQNQQSQTDSTDTETAADSEAEATPTDDDTGWKELVNEKYYYSLEYPRDWKLTGRDADGKEVDPTQAKTEYLSKQYDDKFSNLRVYVHDYDVPKTAKEAAERTKKTADEVIEEKEFELGGEEAYYLAIHNHSTYMASVDGGQDTEYNEDYYFQYIYAVRNGYLYSIEIFEIYGDSEEYVIEPPHIPFEEWRNQETFDKIVESFRFLEYEPPTFSTGCLEFPLQLGNTWKYQVSSSGPFGLEASAVDLAELTGIYDHEFTIRTDTIEGDTSGSVYEERYGVDSPGNNLYANYRMSYVKSSDGDTLASGSVFYHDYKVFSCNEDSWELEVKTSPARFTADLLNEIAGEGAGIIGSAKVLDRDAEVTVPAGDFEAVLIEYNLETSAETNMGDIEVPISQKIWFVPEIGIVKHEMSGITNGTKELIEYNFAN